ncbi:MAG: hypothetical protein A3K09_01250 [Nitrospinae bacterium RIFCSPLOWO2_12_FULL_47_7]|nr:MAG: hypothetical protein A3K09_01250 [Nitrospinae bacterium RIFCSPLOWO2_12_FULL_47_7]
MDTDAHGNRIVGDTLLILMNAYHKVVSFVLPAQRAKTRWEVILDTHLSGPGEKKRIEHGGLPFPIRERSLVVFRLNAGNREAP